MAPTNKARVLALQPGCRCLRIIPTKPVSIYYAVHFPKDGWGAFKVIARTPPAAWHKAYLYLLQQQWQEALDL